MNLMFRIWIVLPALLAMGFSVHAQACDWHVVPGVQGQPALLNLLIGDFAVDPADQPVNDNSISR